MKIAFLSTFYPFRGGIAQFNALVYRVFEKNHTIEAFTFIRQYPDFLFPGKTQMVGPDDRADPIPAKRVLDTINPFSYLKAARKIRQSDPDILLVKYWMTFFAPSLGFVASRQAKKCKRIAILDNMIPHEKRFFDAAFNRYFLKRFDGFVVMSDKVLSDLKYLKPQAAYLRIDHPVYNHFGSLLPQEEARQTLHVPINKKVLLFFGIIRDYKGLNLLLDSLALLDDTYHLLIAGEVYGSFEKYEQQIKSLGLAHRITLHTAYIPDHEVNLFFSASDVCMLTYLSATQSGITAISQHFHLPIIATDVGGLKESVHHEQTGLIIPETKALLIAEGVEYYFDKGLKTKFSANIATYVNENSWENFCSRIITFANEL